MFAYDPNQKMVIPFYIPNAAYFDIDIININNMTIQIKYTRNTRKGFDDKGIVKFIIPFRPNVVMINNSTDGVFLKPSAETDEYNFKNFFIFNFTVLEP